jgi:hypothetical protein
MKEIGPRRSLGLDSFNRELIHVFFGPMSVAIVNPDVIVGLGGGLNVSVS